MSRRSRKTKKGKSRRVHKVHKVSVPKSGVKHDIKVEQDYICPVCGQRGSDSSMDIHHCKNRVSGGSNNRENLVAVHKTCHKKIHLKYGNKFFDPRTMDL